MWVADIQMVAALGFPTVLSLLGYGEGVELTAQGAFWGSESFTR